MSQATSIMCAAIGHAQRREVAPRGLREAHIIKDCQVNDACRSHPAGHELHPCFLRLLLQASLIK